MTLKQEHLKYINEHGKFKVDCSHLIFSFEELDLLEVYGHWFMALIKGNLQPFTEMQIEFIEAITNNRRPIAITGEAWFKYQGRRRIEAKDGDTLNLKNHLIDDTFHSRDMAKKQKRMMYGEMNKNHKK